MKLGLRGIRRLLRSVGNPHRRFASIHIAGTNGKGSTASMIAAMLTASGYKTGLYTSPHVVDFAERIRINGKPISKRQVVLLMKRLHPTVRHHQTTFFETVTALAFLHFAEQEVEIAVVETGLGGRLDATNVTDSIVAAITPISLEHTRILGDTISKITQEKAAIIKNHRQKVVIAPQLSEARNVLKDRCRAFNIDPLWVDEYVQIDRITQDIGRQIFDLSTLKTTYGQLTLALLGKHQRDNAAASICIAECLQDLGFIIPTSAIYEGLKNVFWPGRLEVIGYEPLTLLDGAHNPASAQTLAEAIREIMGEKKVILILGTSEDKNTKSIYDELSRIAKNIIFTKADHPRAANLAGAVHVKEALELAYKAASPKDIILVAGSIFVVSEARRYLLSRKEACIN